MVSIYRVGDLVISHTKTLARAKPGRPALVIDTSGDPGRQHLRLKVGGVEWWDLARCCKKL